RDARGDKMGVVAGLAGKFTRGPAHRNYRSSIADSRIHRGQQIAQAVRGSFDENNRRLWRDGVGPFDVERNFDGPVYVCSRLPSARIHLTETSVGGGACG